jgi:hypothetical protein
MPRFSSTKTFEQVKRARKLSERSHLGVEFPQSKGRVFRTYIPFLQNPIISERGQSNLVEYDLVGRAGSLYSYGGAKSRVINLQFKINLLHLLYSDQTEGISSKFFRQFNLFYADNERAKKAFKMRPGGELEQAEKNVTGAYDAFEEATLDTMVSMGDVYTSSEFKATSLGNVQGQLQQHIRDRDESMQALNETDLQRRIAENNMFLAERELGALEADIGRELMDRSNADPDVAQGKGFPHASTHRAFYREALGIMTGGVQAIDTPFIDGFANDVIQSINNTKALDYVGNATAPTIITPQEQLDRLNRVIDAVYVWVNLVRSTTLNNSTNTTQGPPIVRLNHGPMYNNIPCVVSDYNIEMTQEAGYEVETLTPKELVFTMTLKEVRGSGNFVANEIGDGDNIAGWEAIISNNNIDPYNGAVGRPDEDISVQVPGA